VTEFKPSSRFAHLDSNEGYLGKGIPEPGLSRAEWRALVDQARDSDVLALAQAHGARLRRSGTEFIGPCPLCGGHDRFGVNRRKQLFNCRGCGKGGGPIDLEMLLGGGDFVEAVHRLTNTPSTPRRSIAKAANHHSAADHRPAVISSAVQVMGSAMLRQSAITAGSESAWLAWEGKTGQLSARTWMASRYSM